MDKKYFPIKTETACRLKWSWSTLYLNSGHTSSCHRASTTVITPENFFNFHNTERKIADRQSMIEGKWPGHGCEYCRDIEKLGGYSDRQFQNTVPEVYATEVDSDQLLTTVSPVILEVFFNNNCNLSCLYCTSDLSSRIEAEDKKFGGPIIPITSQYQKNRYEELTPLFWEWMATGYNQLRRLQVMGGEPFLQKDFARLLDYIEENPNPNLELNIVTNLIIPSKTLESFCSRVSKLLSNNKIKRLDLLASVDCWGKEQEYIRNGFSCELFEKNVKYLLGRPGIRLGFLSTVTSLSINSMPELAKKINEWATGNELYWYTHLVLPVDSHVLTPGIFDYNIYKHALEEVISLMPLVIGDKETTVKVFKGIVNKIYLSKFDAIKQQELIKYLEQIDSRRNLNWRETFPWLAKEVIKCGTVK